MPEYDCRRYRTIKIAKARDILSTQSNKCAICGGFLNINKPRNKYWSVDHIIPRSVGKWLEYNIDEEEFSELYKIINDSYNWVITHKSCNENKGSSIPNIKYVESLNISEEHKNKLREILEKSEKYLYKYSEIKKTIYDKQCCKCCNCGKRMGIHNLSLRRKVTYGHIRNVDNAILLCKICEEKRDRFKNSKIEKGESTQHQVNIQKQAVRNIS